MNAVGRSSPKLDCIIDDEYCVLFDPLELNTDAPPEENGAYIRSDYCVNLEDSR